jgi:hypothetical protein
MRAPFSKPNSNEVNELYLLGAGAEGAAGAGACTLTLTFVPPPPNNRPLNANKTTTTMITKITKTATTPALPPPSPLSPMSSLLLWELRIQLTRGCGNDYHRHASRSIIVTEKERETSLVTCLPLDQVILKLVNDGLAGAAPGVVVTELLPQLV